MATPSSRKPRTTTFPMRSEAMVRRALEAAGCRYTAQRAAVLGYLEQVTTHPLLAFLILKKIQPLA